MNDNLLHDIQTKAFDIINSKFKQITSILSSTQSRVEQQYPLNFEFYIEAIYGQLVVYPTEIQLLVDFIIDQIVFDIGSVIYQNMQNNSCECCVYKGLSNLRAVLLEYASQRQQTACTNNFWIVVPQSQLDEYQQVCGLEFDNVHYVKHPLDPTNILDKRAGFSLENTRWAIYATLSHLISQPIIGSGTSGFEVARVMLNNIQASIAPAAVTLAPKLQFVLSAIMDMSNVKFGTIRLVDDNE